MRNLTIVIPTYNEEANIEECINSFTNLDCNIFVIDSYSTDNTKFLAEKLNAIVVQGKWTSFAEKINWAIDNLDIKTEWIMRVDADEILTEKLKDFLKSDVFPYFDAEGIAIRRRLFFMGRLFSYGGLGSLWDVRLWRKNHAKMENRLLDEHLVIDGKLVRLKLDIIDRNRKTMTNWIDKHNNYATLEAQSYLNSKKIDGNSDRSSKIKRFLKNNIYYRIPLFVRPFGYFLFRYIILLGFLDGRAGLIFHVLHSLWFRFLVDVKIYEQEIKQK